LIQAQLGANRAAAMDIVAACSGAYGLSLANSMIRGGQIKYALVIGAESC
jgi:3-oxoacyl-[acyl-carrier-protein] synthase-3